MTFTERAKAYASGVTEGKIDACRMVKLSCQRFLDDLDRNDWIFKAELVERVCGFAELMPHVKGKWARERHLIVLEDWQVFILACLFGFVDEGGHRRFRQAYIMLPRKQGKSILAAVIGLYMLTLDGEAGAEVYCGATSEAQAWEVFRPAKEMAKKAGIDGPGEFLEEYDVEVAAKSIFRTEGSRFQPVIGKPGDGSSPHCAIIDEYHEHASDEQYDTMWTGMGARDQPLMWTITTAGSNVAGPCYTLHGDVVRMLDGTVPNDELFGIIYTVDEGDDWTSDEALQKANPNAGVLVTMDFLRAKVKDAVASSRKQNVVKTKHLNVWTTARTAWMNMEAWNAAADPDLSPAQFAGEPCWVGLDLASKVDIASAARLFVREIKGESGRLEEHFYYFGRHYLPEARVNDDDRRHYQGWVADGYLVATDGDIIDHAQILEDLVADAETSEIQTVGYDPFSATQLAVSLEDAGVPTLEIRQTVAMLSDPMKTLEALVIAGRFHHDGNPAMSWMMSNVTARVDANDNVFPRKEKADNKIDGPVAAIIALAVQMRQPSAAPRAYTTRGVRTL